MPSRSNPHQKSLALMKEAAFDQGVAVERQITVYVRQLIRAGVLAPGLRVPPIRELAKVWGTNYFTVQAALRPLVREGLLVQSPRLGTFVAKESRSLQRVCLYHGEDLKFKGGSEFGGRLHMAVYRMLAARGILTVSHFDHRPAEERDVIPAEVRQLLKDRGVDAVISTTHHETWMDHLDVPMASLEKAATGGGVNWDVKAFARLALEVILQSEARRICVIERTSLARTTIAGAGQREMSRLLELALRAEGLDVIPSPVPETEELQKGMEETGFLIGEKIAAMKVLPDAVVVFPDTYTRGLVSALLKHGVRVPDDMLLISHRNQEMAFFTPLPVVWLTVSIEDYAAALFKQIEQQVKGDPAAEIAVNVSAEVPPTKIGGRQKAPRRKTH